MTRFVYMHGNGTTHWSASFAPQLKRQLEENNQDTFFETMPDSVEARAEYWLPFLDRIAHVEPDDVIIGWSSGAVAGLRYAETHKLKGLVLIGAHYTHLDDDREKASGYFDTPWDWEAIRNNVGTIILYHGDDDPYIPYDDFLYIADMTRADRHEIAGGGHFEHTEEIPGLINVIKTLMS